MENEKLTYINSRGERLELGVDSVYHCNISKDVEGIGDNMFRYDAASGVNSLEVSIFYSKEFLGV